MLGLKQTNDTINQGIKSKQMQNQSFAGRKLDNQAYNLIDDNQAINTKPYLKSNGTQFPIAVEFVKMNVKKQRNDDDIMSDDEPIILNKTIKYDRVNDYNKFNKTMNRSKSVQRPQKQQQKQNESHGRLGNKTVILEKKRKPLHKIENLPNQKIQSKPVKQSKPKSNEIVKKKKSISLMMNLPIDDLIQKNLLKQKQKLLQQQEQENYQKMYEKCKYDEIKIHNEQIRRENAEKFFQKQYSMKEQPFAWGVDQQKIKSRSRDKKSQSSISIHQFLDDKQRRQVIGLDFLQNQNESIIEKLKKKTKIVQQMKLLEQENKYLKAQKQYDQQQLDEVSKMVIKNNRQYKMQRTQQKTLIEQKKEEIKEKLKMLQIYQHQERQRCYEQHKNSPKKSKSNDDDDLDDEESNNSVDVDFQLKYHDMNVKYSQYFQNGIQYENQFNSFKQYQQSDKENIDNNQAKPKDRKKNTKLQDKTNKNIKQPNKQKNEKIKKVKIQQAQVQGNSKRTMPSENYRLNEKFDIDVFDKSTYSERNNLNFEQEQHNQYLIKLDEMAAMIIQKNWRGYKTRKLLSYYLNQLLDQNQVDEEQNQVYLNDDDEMCQFDEDINIQQKFEPSKADESSNDSMKNKRISIKRPEKLSSRVDSSKDSGKKSSSGSKITSKLSNSKKDSKNSQEQSRKSNRESVTIIDDENKFKVDYQGGIKKLKETQINQWNEIIQQINQLQENEVQLGQRAVSVLNNIQKQSEINKKILQDNLEIQMQMTQMSQERRDQMTSNKKNDNQKFMSDEQQKQDDSVKRKLDLDFNQNLDLNSHEDINNSQNSQFNEENSEEIIAKQQEILQKQIEQFDVERFNQAVELGNVHELIQQREHALSLRYQTENDILKQMYKQKQINTNQFAKKMGEIEYWFKKESEGILKTFKEVQKGQYLTEVAIQKTCRDMEFIQQFTNMGSYRQQSSENSIMQQNYMTQSSKDIEVRSNQNIANKNYKFITQDYTSDEKSYDQSIEIGMESLKMLQGNLNKNIISTLGHDSTQELNYKSSKSQEIKEESQDEMYQSEESSLRRSIDNKSLQNSPNKTKNSQKQSQDSSSSNKQSRVKSSYKQSQTTSLNPSNKEEVIDEIPKVLTHDDLDGYQVQRQLQKNMQLSAVPTSISAHTEENLKSQNTSTNQNKSLISENQKKIDQIIQKLGNKFNVDDITDLIMEQLLQELQDDNIVFTNKLDKSTKSVSSARSPKNMDKQFQEQFIVKSPNIKQTIDKVIADDIIGQNGSASTISNKSLGGYGSPEEIIRDVTKELENSNQIYQLSIKTNLAFIHEFMNCLLQVIKDGYQNELIRILNSYANFSALERLALVNQIVQIRNNENSLQLSFTNFNSSVVFNLRYQQQSKKENMLPDELLEAIYQKYYTNSQHNQYFSVHSKLVFDAFNESLQLFRAQKYINSTVPWKNFFNHYNQKQIQPQQVEKILEKCKDRVIEWASSICGFIPDKEDSPVNNLNVQLDDEYLGQIKEERMAKMLQNEVLENVENWTLYEDEEAEIQIEVSNIIFDHLIHDLVTEIMCLQKQRSQSSYFA